MPKRSYNDSEEEKWERKLEKYQRKLQKKRKKSRVIIYSDSEATDNELLQENENEVLSNPPVTTSLTEPDDNALDTDSVSHTLSSENIIIDPDFLQALGDNYTEEPEWGENILEDISQRWKPILNMGLKKDLKEEVIKKYLVPKNMAPGKAPLLNPEIASIITESSRNRDKRLMVKQNQLGRALSGLGKAMSGLMTKSMTVPQALHVLNDVGKLIADSHFLETDTRRSLITPLLDKSFIEPIKDRKRDSYLFGEKLNDFIKSSRGIKKSGQLITSVTSSNLNWRSPATSTIPRQTHRTGRAPPSRSAGGSRAQWSARRRAPQALPPLPTYCAPATRRQAAPATASTSYRPPPAPSTSRPRNPTK